MWQKQILTKAFINAFIWLIWGDVYRYLATATMVWTLLQTLQCPSWKVSTTPPHLTSSLSSLQGWSELNQSQGFSPSSSLHDTLSSCAPSPDSQEAKATSSTRHISTWRLSRTQCRQSGCAQPSLESHCRDQSLLWLRWPSSWRRGSLRTPAMYFLS